MNGEAQHLILVNPVMLELFWGYTMKSNRQQEQFCAKHLLFPVEIDCSLFYITINCLRLHLSGFGLRVKDVMGSYMSLFDDTMTHLLIN